MARKKQIGVPMYKLSRAIIEALQEYNQEASDKIQIGFQKAAEDAVKELKSTSPKKTGKYSKSWNANTQYQSSDDIRIVIHSKSPHYRLTHLLEYGHARPNGGRKVDARPHIKEAEQNAIKKAMEVVRDAYGK